MEQGLGISVQRLDLVVCLVALLTVIQSYEEGGLLNGVQRVLVLAPAEVHVTSLGPWGPGKWGRIRGTV